MESFLHAREQSSVTGMKAAYCMGERCFWAGFVTEKMKKRIHSVVFEKH